MVSNRIQRFLMVLLLAMIVYALLYLLEQRWFDTHIVSNFFRGSGIAAWMYILAERMFPREQD